MNNFSIAIRIGLLWGIGSILFSLIQYLITGAQNTSILLSILVFLAGIAITYYIGIKRREQIGGFISWKEAMTHMWVGGILSVLLSTIFIFILYNYIDPDLKQKLIETQVEYIEKFRGTMGDSAADLQIEKLENSDPFDFKNVLLILGGGLLIQFIISCLVALAVKRENPSNQAGTMKEIIDNF